MPNRTICSVLNEMRESIKTLNFSYLSGLIEEAQSLANRMEAGLWDQKDIENLREDRKKLEQEVKELETKLGKI